MTQYNNINANLSNSQVDKLKWATRNSIRVILRLLSSIICINGNSFPQKLLLTDGQVLCTREYNEFNLFMF